MVHVRSSCDLVPGLVVHSIAMGMSNPSNSADLEQLLGAAVDRFDGIIAQHPATQSWPRERVHQEALSVGSAMLDVALGYARRRASARRGAG